MARQTVLASSHPGITNFIYKRQETISTLVLSANNSGNIGKVLWRSCLKSVQKEMFSLNGTNGDLPVTKILN